MRGVWLRILRLLRPRASEREIDEEIRFHVDMESAKYRREGLDPEAARRRALIALGGWDRWHEEIRAARGTAWLEDAVRDVRLAARALMRSPGFAAAAIGVIALGVGATTAIYSVVDQVVLASLPYPRSDELVTVWMRNPRQGTERDVTSWPNFLDWRAAATTFEGMATVLPTRYTLTGIGDAEEVLGASVSAGFFRLVGAPMALGRPFRADENELDFAHTVVLSYALFSRRFGADPSVVGRTIRLDGAPYEVVGVARPDVGYPRGTELWTPQAFGTNRAGMYPRWRLLFPVIGRLKSGTALSTAQAQMDAIAARLEAAYPDADRGVRITLEPLRDAIVGNARTPLLILLGAVAAVLLIVVVVVANLLLARGTARAREVAARIALGAGRGRIVRQVLTESALLGGVGGLLGAALASLGVTALVAAGPVGLPRLDEVHPDWRMLAVALTVSFGASLVFGLAPALRAGSQDPAVDLRKSTGASSGRLDRARGAFIVGQSALALVLLVGFGLLLQSFLNVRAVDPGFDPAGVLSVQLRLQPGRYADGASSRVFQQRVMSTVAALPGVESVGTTSDFFVGEQPRTGTPTVEGREGQFGPDRQVPVVGATVSPGFFATVRMHILAGRGFRETDGPDDAPIAVVNQTFARTFLAGLDPIGRRFTWLYQGKGSYWFTIVGVIDDARRSGLAAPVRPAVFTTTSQRFPPYQFELLVRTSGDLLRLAPAVRDAVHRIDAAVPVSRVHTLEQAMADSLAQRRFVSWMLGLFALAALALAATGVFGVMAYVVGQRRREIGIRVALGAARSRIMADLLREGMLHAGAGLLVGTLASLALAPLIRGQLFEVGAADPVTFTAAAIVLFSVALAACAVPARRAAAVDAMVALREE